VPPESRASEESVRHLLDVMGARKIVETISAQVDTMYSAKVSKMLEGTTLTDEQQKEIEQRRQKTVDLIKQMLNWDSMEKMYLKVYADTFTQGEIDGMLTFYTSTTGQAVIAKLPLAAKNAMTEMQSRVQTLVPQIQQMAQETADQIKAQDTAAKRKSG
jgi:uncharacterized protein